MESEMDLIRMDYKKKIIRQIGRNIKAARKADNEYEKNMYRHFALALWDFGSTTRLLSFKQSDGIRKQIFTDTFNTSEIKQ